jgi:hypothetical protein
MDAATDEDPNGGVSDGDPDDVATQRMVEASESEESGDDVNHALRFANDPRKGGKYCLEDEKDEPRVESILCSGISQHDKLVAAVRGSVPVGAALSDAKSLVRTPAQLRAALAMENAQPEFRKYSETHAAPPEGIALRDLRKQVASRERKEQTYVFNNHTSLLAKLRPDARSFFCPGGPELVARLKARLAHRAALGRRRPKHPLVNERKSARQRQHEGLASDAFERDVKLAEFLRAENDDPFADDEMDALQLVAGHEEDPFADDDEDAREEAKEDFLEQQDAFDDAEYRKWYDKEVEAGMYSHQFAQEHKECAAQQQLLEERARAEKRAHNKAFLAGLLLLNIDTREMAVAQYGQEIRDSHRGMHSATGKHKSRDTPAWFRTPFENEDGTPATTVLRPGKGARRSRSSPTAIRA